MKKIIMLPLLPITLLLILCKKYLELIMPLAEDIGNGILNIVNKNCIFWEEIWTKFTKSILHRK